jgi:glycolate oxidase iron-sulfur subunit
LIESTRAMLAPARPGPLRRIARWIFAEPARLRRLLSLAALYERSGMRRLLQRSGAGHRLPRRIRMTLGLAPPMRPRFSRDSGGIVPARWPAQGRVGFLTGCVMRESFGDVHEAAAAVLSRLGLDVVVPASQVCCGALAAHAGDVAGAKALARRNIEAFEDTGVSTIVVDSAGCGAYMKDYGELLADEPELAARASALASRTKDFAEVVRPLADRLRFGTLPLRVTYQDPCHLAHAQGIRAAPRELLAMIPGLELVEMREADRCCGSAGVYNLTQPELSERVLELKMVDLLATRPQAVVTANPGCMMQLRYGLERAGVDLPVQHIAEILDQSARAAETAAQ